MVMTKAAQPWMKFYPQDWRADEKLRLCSLAARGLWMEMLAIMHRSERYGQLLIGGHVPTDAQLAVQVGALPDEVTALVAEISDAGVFSRAGSGAIYSRRMTRDHRKAETARKNGKRGGNPTLSKQTNNSPSVNQEVKGGVKPQKPETRDSDTKVSGSAAGDILKSLFDLGVSLLVDRGHGPKEARSLVGSWRKGRQDADVLAAIIDCQAKGISNPVEWMPKRLAQAAASPSAYTDHVLEKYRKAA